MSDPLVTEEPKTFRCEECGDVFQMGDDSVAQAEAVESFGKRGDDPGMAIVCDDCYNTIMAERRAGQ